VQQVLVLNASFEPLNVCSLRRAHVLVFKGKAEVLEEHETPLHSATDTFARPHVIRLVQYVRVPQPEKRKISRRALFARDGWSCVYCGTAGGRLTLDHVVPRSRGGDSGWSREGTLPDSSSLQLAPVMKVPSRKRERSLLDSISPFHGQRNR
jgi:hypothetical protein